MSDRSDSIAAALNYSSTGRRVTKVAGAAGAGHILGILASYGSPADAADWAMMAAVYTASKNGQQWPVSAFWGAYRHQVLLTAEAQLQG